jgi:hypothetical protein
VAAFPDGDPRSASDVSGAATVVEERELGNWRVLKFAHRISQDKLTVRSDSRNEDIRQDPPSVEQASGRASPIISLSYAVLTANAPRMPGVTPMDS